MVQTYVLKFLPPVCAEMLQGWAKAHTILGAGAVAVVINELVPSGQPPELFLVMTLGHAHSFPEMKIALKKSLNQLPDHPKVEWISALDRRLQRLFGWGDVCTTEADVARACQEKDVTELRAVVPQAALLDVPLEVMPQLFTALQGPPQPQLEDCKHEFFDEHPWEVVVGPCARCSRKGETRCKVEQCGLVLCERCALDSYEDRAERQQMQELTEKARAYRPVYWQHEHQPLPFYVRDYQDWDDDKKLEWLKQQVERDAGIAEFAKAFRRLFDDKLRDHGQQKVKVFKLYNLFSPRAAGWKKASDIPPAEREEFQRVWNEDAPDLCLECGKALAEGEKDYHAKCMNLDKVVVCTKDQCGGKVRVQAGVFVCTVCGNGQKVAATVAAGPIMDGPFAASSSRTLDSLRRVSNLVSCFTTAADPDHSPEWKKQKKS